MAASDHLYQLIHTMTATEKAYFKKFAYKHGRNDNKLYLKLFDSMDRQSVYNEEKLIAKYKKQGLSKSFSSAKHYLNNLVLSSLVDYNKNKSIHAQLHQNLEEIDVLYKKGLFEQGLKIVRKAQKLAGKHEKFHIILELIRWEEELLHVQNDIEKEPKGSFFCG